MRMSPADINDLCHLVNRMRALDWSPLAIRGAIHHTVTDRGGNLSAAEICIAVIAAAMNPLNETPDAIWRPGPHWDALPGYLRTGRDPNKVHRGIRDRQILDAAAADMANRDPEGSRRGYLAASRALAEAQARPLAEVQAAARA